MSIDQKNVIDFISTNSEGKVVLTISNHYSWDEKFHLNLLNEKLNSYLHFIQSGQIYNDYPNSIDRELIIRLTMKYKPDHKDYEVLENVQKTLSKEGIIFQWNILQA